MIFYRKERKFTGTNWICNVQNYSEVWIYVVWWI